MPSWDKAKDKRNPATLRSGAFPSDLLDAQDTDPMSIDTSAFDDDEDTRHDHGPRLDSENLVTVQGLTALDEEPEPTVRHQGTTPGEEDRTHTTSSRSAPQGEWDLDDVDGFWMRVHAIEAAGNESDEALDAALAEHGLRDKAHFDEVRERFQQAYAHDPNAFMQAAIDARTRATKQAMQARMQGSLKGELAPVEGITLEQWAWLMAKIASGGNLAQLLSLAKLDQGKWERVSAEWNARMSRDTTATIATAYGQAFVATGPGPFGEAGKQTAAAMLDPSKRDVDGKPPITMEKWIEITEAQSAASQRGQDAASVLKRYGMTPADWGVVGGWWSQHFNANAMKLIGEYNRLSDHYKKKFAG
jgi:hypothetical protein